jgi:phage anti-repressor protein
LRCPLFAIPIARHIRLNRRKVSSKWLADATIECENRVTAIPHQRSA